MLTVITTMARCRRSAEEVKRSALPTTATANTTASAAAVSRCDAALPAAAAVAAHDDVDHEALASLLLAHLSRSAAAAAAGRSRDLWAGSREPETGPRDLAARGSRDLAAGYSAATLTAINHRRDSWSTSCLGGSLDCSVASAPAACQVRSVELAPTALYRPVFSRPSSVFSWPKHRSTQVLARMPRCLGENAPFCFLRINEH